MPEISVGLLLNDIPGLRTKFFRTLKDNIFTAICNPNFLTYNYYLIEDGMLDVYRKDNIQILAFVLDESFIDAKSYKTKVDNIIFEERIQKIEISH